MVFRGRPRQTHACTARSDRRNGRRRHASTTSTKRATKPRRLLPPPPSRVNHKLGYRRHVRVRQLVGVVARHHPLRGWRRVSRRRQPQESDTHKSKRCSATAEGTKGRWSGIQRKHRRRPGTNGSSLRGRVCDQQHGQTRTQNVLFQTAPGPPPLLACRSRTCSTRPSSASCHGRSQ